MNDKVKNPNCVGVCRKAMEMACVECPAWNPETLERSSYEERRKAILVIKNSNVPCQKERCPVGHDYESETYINALCGDIGGFAGDR